MDSHLWKMLIVKQLQGVSNINLTEAHKLVGFLHVKEIISFPAQLFIPTRALYDKLAKNITHCSSCELSVETDQLLGTINALNWVFSVGPLAADT